MKKTLMILAAILSQSAWSATYELDKTHTEVGFGIKHMMISNVKGRFNKFSGGFEFDEAKKELKNVKVEIETASIDTNEPDRDKHLRNADFFNVEKNPTITFVGEKAEFKGSKPAKITGQLTMNGQTKPVTLDIDYRGTVVDPWGKTRLGFGLTGKLNRKDWGLSWNKALDKGGLALGEEVTLNIESEALVVGAAAPAKK